MTEESVKYENGDIVWVKLLYCWWPGEVLSLDKVPDEVRESFKQPPLAVVRFFQEDTFEYIKSGHSKNICLYTSEKKNDYIKRGMDLVRSKTKASLMTKFPADVCTAERLTGGNTNILNEPQFAELLVPSSSASGATKRRNSSGDSSTGVGAPSGRNRGRGKGRGRGGSRGGRMSTGSIMENKFFSSPSPKKPKKEIIVTHPRFINDDIDDHEVVRLIQTKRPSIESPVREEFFNCNTCEFKTTRVDVLVMHRESHSQKPTKWRTTTPKKPRKTFQMPRSNTKTLEEDIALVRSGKTVEDFLSDEEETTPKRAKKTKPTPKYSKEKKDKKEKEMKVDTLELTKKEELKKIDREQLVAEWNEIEESEDEALENNENKIEESKTEINDAIKSCFDFEEEDESNGILTAVEGRKIPRVIPEAERSQSPKDQQVLISNSTENSSAIDEPADASIESVNNITKDDSEPVPPDEKLVTPKEPDISDKESPAATDIDLGLESFASILEATNVPVLPEIPEIREKCEQNFHDPRTIKFPDKSDPTPIQINKEESNGIVEKAPIVDITPLAETIDTTIPLIEPVKPVVATKLTNPKKRFVRSFQEEKAKVQDRLEQMQKEKLAKELEQERESELLKETSERVQHVENIIEELPEACQKVPEDLPNIVDKKRIHHVSKKSERKSKYKPKRRAHYAEPETRTEIVTDIVNSFKDHDTDDDNTNKNKLAEEPFESNNSVIELKPSEEPQNGKAEPVTDHNVLSITSPLPINVAEDAYQSKITTESSEDHQPEALEDLSQELQPEVLQAISKNDTNDVPAESMEESKTELEVTQEPVKEVNQHVIEELTDEELSPHKTENVPITLIHQDSNIVEVEPTEKISTPVIESNPVEVEPFEKISTTLNDLIPLEVELSEKISTASNESIPSEGESSEKVSTTLSESKSVEVEPSEKISTTLNESSPAQVEYSEKISTTLNESSPAQVEYSEKISINLNESSPVQVEPTEIIPTPLSESKPLEAESIEVRNDISAEIDDTIEVESEPIVNEESKLDSCPMEIEDTYLFPKKRTKKLLDLYACESAASTVSPDKTIDSKFDDYNPILPSSLPESPKSDGISLLNSSVEIETKNEELNEPNHPCETLTEVDTQAEKHTIENNVICSNEIQETNILINTGNHNSEELSALNTLATLSEMIQPEFDIRALRHEENTLSTLDATKESKSVSENISVVDEKSADMKEHLDDCDAPDAEIIPTTTEIEESVPELNNDISKSVQDVMHATENAPELNETVPEVLDKITVFPDEQLVKGQMEIVTLNSSDPVSNDSLKTDMELESVQENISVITETKNKKSKAFIVHDPEFESDYKKLTTENTTVLETPKTGSISAIEEKQDVESLQSTNKDDVKIVEKDSIPSPTNVDCDKFVVKEDEFLSTNQNATVPEEIQKVHEIPLPPTVIPTPTPIADEPEAAQPTTSHRNLESRMIISQSDTLSAAIANTIESEMAKLTDTAVDVATLPIQQRETSSSKLLEILSETKPVAEKPKRSQILQQQYPVEAHKKQMLLNRGSFSGVHKPPNKPIILSEQIIKPAKNETDSVVVQKVSNKRTLEDFEDIDAYIIQKPGKKPVVRQETEITPPAPKIMKKSSPRSRPRILQQTIITAAGDVIQPDGQQQDDQAMFDINSMPIVLTDQILTPETIDNIPMILQDSPQTSKIIQTMKNTQQTVKLLNKATNESVIKSSPKATVIRSYHKAPQRPSTGSQKKGILTVPTTQVKTNYILVPSTASPSATSSASLTGNKKTTIKRQGTQLLLQTTKTAATTSTTAEPTGNKIMIVTNNLGQQQRVVLTPAQHKLFMQQNNTKLKITNATATTMASKIVKANAKPNILSSAKSSLISTSTSSGQTILLAPTQMITPLTAQQMKAATKVAPTKFKVTKYIHAAGVLANQQQGSPIASKTIIFRNQQGQTLKKLNTIPETDLDRQVAEQIEAIKAAEAVKNSVKVNQAGIPVKDVKVPKQMLTKKLVASVKPQLQQQLQTPIQQQRKSVVRKTFSDSARSLALAGSSRAQGTSSSVPPLTPLVSHTQLPIQETIPSAVHTTLEKSDPSSFVAPTPVNLSPDKDGEKRQLVMQDDQGNMSAIPVGQILAIPNETIDGQAQSYVLVTMDETGNLMPINQETLMSIDPNILGNMVVQNDAVAPKSELEMQKGTEKLSLPAVVSQDVPETAIVPSLIPEPHAPTPTSDYLPSEQTAPISETASALTQSEIPINLHSTTCNINNGDVNKQVVITGDPIVTQKFLESLAGNQELFNLLANAEGNLLIHSDGQQILINTTNTTVENTMLDQPDSIVEDRNPVMSNPSTKSHDILAAALADTDVIPSKLPPSQLSPGTSLYSLHTSNVLETSAMHSPIMTPLEVTETHSKKIDDILGQVPKSVSDLPITITDPNIVHTVAQQQLSNDIHPNLELPLSIPDPSAPTSVGMNSPSFPSYSLPNLDEDLSQKSFGQSISMPLLTDEPDEPGTVATTEERSCTTDSLTDTEVKLDTTSASIMSTKEEYSLVDRMCSMRNSRICSSLSEPPPDMFDYTPEPVDEPEHLMQATKSDCLLQKVTAAMKKAFESDLPSTHNDDDLLTDDNVVKVENTFVDSAVQDEHKLTLPSIESDKISVLPLDTTELDKIKMKEELFEPNLTPQFHSPSTNTDDSCEIPVQPPIVTALDDNKSDEPEVNDTEPCIDECEHDNKGCKLT